MPALALRPDLAEWATLAAALVNTRPREASPAEKLDAPAVLGEILGRAPEPPPRAARTEDLDAARALRAQLLTAFRARDTAELADALNPLLGAPGWGLRAGAGGWELGPAPAGELVPWLGVRMARGLAELAAVYGTERLHACAAEDCQAVLVDVSRNGARRFCSRTCSSRINVRKHRQRA
jgi:predicted RNA-binding Zn ribbon-like protein